MYWKLALAQHPMYILIKEDTGCAERTPPWGAPDIETYIARLRRNIATLRKYPQVKIGYEWSGLELELLKEDAPEVFAEMLELARKGQTTFYNGTYSQPHLQTLSSESNYRQFEWGARVYRQLADDWRVKVYAHQESSVNDQTPQLLKAFGIRFGVLPHFSSTLRLVDGGEILFHARHGTMFIHGEEFAVWQGLDGALLPLYLEEPAHMSVPDWINFQEVMGLTHVPPILVEIPDLIDVDEGWIRERSKADFALLDDALEERYRAFPPRFKARLYTNWSYIEGIRAEELSRNNFKAEAAALRAEALNALAYGLLKRPAESTDPAWKKILTTQHHDVYCFCAPELRGKSIGWLQEAEAEASGLAQAAAEALAGRIAFPAHARPLVVFNTVPHPQVTVISAEVAGSDPVVLDASGRALPAEVTAGPSGKSRVRFVAGLRGLGYSTFQVKSGGDKSTEGICADPFTFANRYYSATLRPDGAFTSIRLQPSGEELLAGDAAPANVLAGCDSTGLGPKHEDASDGRFFGWQKWEPSGRGPELRWLPSGPACLRRSPLGAVLTVAGSLGPAVKAALSVSFYTALPRIDLEWTFDFDEASIGHFFDDETKLRVQWPLAFSGTIHHDIAFGVVETRDERPFFPAHWTDISDGKRGLAYFHQGTIKHWVSGRTLSNLFAWGEHTDAIGNRLDMVRWPKCFDQRLNGRHAIQAAVLPHSGDWRSAGLIGVSRGFNQPPMALAVDPHPGELPAERTLMSLDDPEIAATAVRVEDGAILTRMYSVKESPSRLEPQLDGVRVAGMEALTGETLDRIGPFQIARLRLALTGQTSPGS